MKGQELRIGNLINYEATTHIVTSIQNEIGTSVWLSRHIDEDIYQHSWENCKPITLTDEWFEKFEGFYKDGEYWSISINDYKYCFKYRDWAKNWAFYQEYTDSPFPEDDGKKHPVSFDIEYVHQLQNLYFALQHEELILIK